MRVSGVLSGDEVVPGRRRRVRELIPLVNLNTATRREGYTRCSRIFSGS